jgi:hypothetical protein
MWNHANQGDMDGPDPPESPGCPNMPKEGETNPASGGVFVCTEMGGTKMTEYILLVTWFFGRRPLDSYQVIFSSRDACQAAQIELKKEESRLLQISGGAQVVPILSSVCVAH